MFMNLQPWWFYFFDRCAFMSLQSCSMRGPNCAVAHLAKLKRESLSVRKEKTLRQKLTIGRHDDRTALFVVGEIFDAFCPKPKFK